MRRTVICVGSRRRPPCLPESPRSTNLTFNCYSGTCSGDYVKTIRTTETASLPASVQGGLVFTCYGGTCSRSYFLVFELRNDKYTAWNN